MIEICQEIENSKAAAFEAALKREGVTLENVSQYMDRVQVLTYQNDPYTSSLVLDGRKICVFTVKIGG